MNPNKSSRFMPLMMALCVIVGIVIGSFYANHFSGNKLNIINTGSNRINNLLHIINDQYVDEVSLDSLVEGAMPKILAELDPHSVYITAKDAQAANQELLGSFSGVGIEFTIREDTLHVQNVIQNGPAEQAGIIAGDKIVMINDKPFVGKAVSNQEAMKKLKGQKGTKVKLGVQRYGQTKPLNFTVTRGDIPIKSISAAYMIDETTGYVRIKSFGETTYAELLVAFAKLGQSQFKNLIIDLRDNTGGYLQSAVQIANEFLPKNKLIVYTEGRKSPRENFISDGHGSYKNMPLTILINEASASASEILAGALQDNDRATIIGRRSFGKGLVQRQIGFADGSMIRLTTARYYSPSGRCIQKPYTIGEDPSYAQDLISRYEHGEFFSQDSIKHQGPAYHTTNGRLVYGGGGITPDIFVPEDTTGYTSYYKQASMSGLILQFAFTYVDNNRPKLGEYSTASQLESYLNKQNIVNQFVNYADQHGLRRRNLMIRKSHKLFTKFLVSRIIYNMLNEEALLEYLNKDDQSIIESLKLFKNDTWLPKPQNKQDLAKKKTK